MKEIDRREFLKQASTFSGKTMLAGTALSALGHGKVLGANERVHLALVGCGGRGRILARGFIEENGAAVTHLCDLNPERLDRMAQELGSVQGRKPRQSSELQAVLDDKDVDGVIAALPQHWHAPVTIQACQAGKDVYVEKPHSHNIWEGRKMIEAARKYKRIVQVGTQSRSAPYNFAARELVQSGKLGKLPLVKVYNLKPGNAFHLGEPGKPPRGFNWDTWLGPAALRPFHKDVYRRWHHFWDFSGGDLCLDGVHQLDLAMMLLGNPGFPKSVSCTAGRYAHAGDDAETPDLQIATYQFDNFIMVVEASTYPRYMQKTTTTIRRRDEFPYWTQNATRIELYGFELMMTIGRHGGGWITTTSGGKIVDKQFGRPSDYEHEANFLDCIKSRKQPTADLETLHVSCSMLHMANIAHRIGNTTLTFDAKNERFPGNAAANKLLKRAYRPGHSIPENV